MAFYFCVKFRYDFEKVILPRALITYNWLMSKPKSVKTAMAFVFDGFVMEIKVVNISYYC